MNVLGPAVPVPDWMSTARRYYSRIEGDRHDSVRVMKPPVDVDASDTNPGTLCLHLVGSSRAVRVFDAAGEESGVIRSRGPGLGYRMRRGDDSLWTLSTRSLVMRRHALAFSDETWQFLTPFFWWMNIEGTTGGVIQLLGRVGPSKRLWFLWINPDKDHDDLLSAVGFMHRRWWRL